MAQYEARGSLPHHQAREEHGIYQLKKSLARARHNLKSSLLDELRKQVPRIEPGHHNLLHPVAFL